MEMKSIFNKYNMPEQYIFAGQDYLYIIKKKNKEFIKNNRIYRISLNNLDVSNLDEDTLYDIKAVLGSQPTGIVLNSSYFVFNILKFDKIPSNKKKLGEIVNWRIARIFPEDQSLYIHQYYILNSEYILSVLIRKEIKKTIDEFFHHIGVKQTYLGNSSIELINLLYDSSNPLKKIIGSQKTADFFIEIWGNFAIIIFQNNLIPFYIRKFNFLDERELITEIEKNINYINSNYSISTKSYSLFANNSNFDYEIISDNLHNLNLVEIEIEKKSSKFIHGVSI